MKCKLEKIMVHYEVLGEGKPIVMLHGWPLDHRVLLSTLEPIFKKRHGWKRIYPDLPGMGKTPGMDWITHQDQVLEVVLDFIDNVAPGQRVTLAGYSYGGYLARGVVTQRAATMDGLLLVAPNIFPKGKQKTLPTHAPLVKNPELISALEANLAQAFEGFAVVQSQELLESMVNTGLPARQVADLQFLDTLAKNFEFSFDVDILTEPFGGPTLMIMGRQDSICGYHDAWNLLESYPRGTFVVLDRAGHGLMIEQKNMFAALMNEWLDRVEEFAGMDR